MDPLMDVAVGSAAGKAVEIVGDLIKDGIARFKEHRKATKKQEQANLESLAVEMRKGFQQLEASNTAIQERMNRTVIDPAFVMWIESVRLNAAKTSRKDKHILFARLVMERLQSEPENLLSMDIEQASDVIAKATPTGLRILGLKSTLDRLEPKSPAPLSYSGYTKELLLEWVVRLLSPYKTLTYTDLQMQKLRSLSCITGRTGMLAPSLIDYVSNGRISELKLEDFEATEVGAHISDLWSRHGLISAELTGVGLLIGIFVSDTLQNTVTDLSAWDQAEPE